MALRKKILLGYGVAFALMAVVFAWAVVNLVALGKASDAILQENYRSILAAENMIDALERQDSAVLITIFSDKDQGAAQFRENEVAFLQWLARAKDNITIEGEVELVQSIESDYADYLTMYSGLTESSGDGPSSASPGARYRETAYPLFAKVREACGRLRTLNEDTMYAASARAGEVATRATWSTVGVAAVTFLIALVFNLVLSARIVRPLRHLMEASRQVAGGDYAVKVPVESADEVGLLADEFNQMATKLQQYHQMNVGKIIAEKQKGEAILASIDDGLVVLDAELRITDLNPAARRMLGVDLAAHRSRSCTDILPDPRICEIIQKTAESGVPPEVDEEERIISLTIGGKPRYFLFSVTAIRSADGEHVGIVLLLRDVTRLKEVERLKSEFIMAASHELRNPLTGMAMSIDLLSERTAEKLEPRDRELLQAAHEEMQRLTALVEDLLDLSKIEAGRIEMEFESVAPELLFERAAAVFESQLKERSVQLEAEALEGLPDVRADPNKITWVLTNLISNSLRYVPGGGHIWVSGRHMGRHVHLSVRDDGPGIPLEYQNKIFQKFVQVKGRDTAGTGLGLAICKEIVRAHGGTIWVESTPGRGSIFTFTLPVVGQEA
ncbi:MAG: cell wall metabolism sensor histidine kinase WalK [Thermoleophilia bacterium]|nr:cell wall metabolism sensor histidine kinase WalK [Thermoleophilia bacterium]